MTEHDTTDHVSAIKAHLQSMVILSQLNEEDGSAFTEAFFSHYEDANRAADALAARIAAAEARCQRFEELLRMTGELYDIEPNAVDAMIATASDGTQP